MRKREQAMVSCKILLDWSGILCYQTGMGRVTPSIRYSFNTTVVAFSVTCEVTEKHHYDIVTEKHHYYRTELIFFLSFSCSMWDVNRPFGSPSIYVCIVFFFFFFPV